MHDMDSTLIRESSDHNTVKRVWSELRYINLIKLMGKHIQRGNYDFI